MQLRLIAVGRLREPYLIAAAEDFRRRLRPYHRLEEIDVRDDAAVLGRLRPDDHVWLLERTGTMFSSEELARRLERLPVEGISRVTFVIAGADGAGAALLERANVRWSLSPLTFLHEWARALVLEQLYRAAKIAANEPYHH
ncbi:MAG TPA: 23S rRNA (pseudouridine(1915)-N(3))-methyltransferase RlmH [Candidatus Lustribacter sp.]|nr:23S rRNA (pseudouridine(1915)-N(3))-methyltransferase RlmH [Candidatus Lustribacter sp.]